MRKTNAGGTLASTSTTVLGFLAMVIATGCASHPVRGHLLIIGGGLQNDNAAVYGRFVELADDSGRIGVLPTASGVPEESGPGAAETLSMYTHPHRPEVINLTVEQAARAHDAATVEQITTSRALWFTGGDQSRIVEVFRPESGDTLAFEAVRHVLSSGGVIAGTSAAAAAMSDPMIYMGRSDRALRDGVSYAPQPGGVVIGRGLGLFPFGLVDQHVLRRGRFGRLIVALEATGQTYGYGVADNGAMHVDLAGEHIEAIGDDSVLLVNLRDARHYTCGCRSGVRLSLLGDGDGVAARTARVIPHEGRRVLTPDATATRDAEPIQFTDDVFGSDAVSRIMHELAAGPGAIQARSSELSFAFSVDERTRFYRGGDDEDDGTAASLCVTNVRLDIVPIPPCTRYSRITGAFYFELPR